MVGPTNWGVGELLIVLLIVLLLFGAGKMRSVARDLGQSVACLKRALTEDPKGDEDEGKDA